MNSSFIRDNWEKLIAGATFIFACGTIYSQFQIMNKDNAERDRRIDMIEKQSFEELEERVDELEEQAAYRRGYEDALKSKQ